MSKKTLIVIGTILVIIIISGYIFWLRSKTDDFKFKRVIVGVKIDQSLQQDMRQKTIEETVNEILSGLDETDYLIIIV